MIKNSPGSGVDELDFLKDADGVGVGDINERLVGLVEEERSVRLRISANTVLPQRARFIRVP